MSGSSGKNKDMLIDCIIKNALIVPDNPVILSSGKTSYYYFDVKRAVSEHDGINTIVDSLYSEILTVGADSVGGMEFGAVPLLFGLVTKYPLRVFVVRKERKKHGLEKDIEGILKGGDRVVIIDDVTTSGGSVIKAINTVKENFNVDIVKVVSVVDREEGAKERIENEMGIEFKPLVSFSELKPFVSQKLQEKYGPDYMKKLNIKI